jgi:hypothetical protein
MKLFKKKQKHLYEITFVCKYIDFDGKESYEVCRYIVKSTNAEKSIEKAYKKLQKNKKHSIFEPSSYRFYSCKKLI